MSGPITLVAGIEPPSAATRVTFSVDGRAVCTMERPPFECEWDAGFKRRVAPGAARHRPGGRRPHRAHGANQGAAVRRERRRRRRAGDRHRDRRGRPVRAGSSAVGVSRVRRRPPQTITHFTSEDVPLELVVAIDISGSMTPAMPKLKAAVEGLAGRRAGEEPGDAARVQRQHLCARTQGHRSGRAGTRGRSPGAVGCRRRCTTSILRGVGDARPPGRAQGARRVHRRRGSGQPRGHSTTSSAGCSRATSRYT